MAAEFKAEVIELTLEEVMQALIAGNMSSPADIVDDDNFELCREILAPNTAKEHLFQIGDTWKSRNSTWAGKPWIRVLDKKPENVKTLDKIRKIPFRMMLLALQIYEKLFHKHPQKALFRFPPTPVNPQSGDVLLEAFNLAYLVLVQSALNNDPSTPYHLRGTPVDCPLATNQWHPTNV